MMDPNLGLSARTSSRLDVRDDLRELADHYETVAAADPASQAGGATSKPGPRLPPGAMEMLDADEVRRALEAVDEWAEFCAHVLVDERDATAPDSTPARLRMVGEHVEHFLDHDDVMLSLSFVDDLREHLRSLRRLARRGVRIVRTGMVCQDPTCSGQYVSALAPAGQGDDAIECERCHHRVPHSVWSGWPRARVEWVTVEHAARIAGTTVAAVKMRASRGKWRRTGSGADVRYNIHDVRGEATAMAS